MKDAFTLCTNNQIADIMHFVLERNALSSIRQEYLEPRFCERQNTFKFYELISAIKLLKNSIIYA